MNFMGVFIGWMDENIIQIYGNIWQTSKDCVHETLKRAWRSWQKKTTYKIEESHSRQKAVISLSCWLTGSR